MCISLNMATVDEEIKNIKDDIKLSGFPLELLKSSILIKNGWNVGNQVYYFDEAEKKNRTVDIIAHKPEFKVIGDYDRVNFNLVLECKKSTTPWVFYAMEREAEDQILDSIGVIKLFSNPDALKSRDFIKWLEEKCHYGYNYSKDFA